MSPGPRYRFTLAFTLRWIIALLRDETRSLAADSTRCLAAAGASPRVVGAHHLPETGSFVLVANHYQRPGLWVGWSTMAITAAVTERRRDLRRSLHWLVTAEWPLVLAGRTFPNPVLRRLFSRLAHLYDLVLLPALDGQVEGRAGALRGATAAVTRRGPHHAVALFPEGRSGTALLEARPGSGDLLLLMTRLGVPVVPCGVCEDQGRLTVAFGPPVGFSGTRGLAREERDREAGTAAMVAIGCLVQRRLWGVYAEEIESAMRGEVPATGRGAATGQGTERGQGE